MLNKLIKIIEITAIIGLNGLDVWGSDDYEIWDGTGPMPTENVLIKYNLSEGIKRVTVFKHTNDPIPELAREEDQTKPSYGRIGLRLNFPEELIQDCEDKHWKIYDENLKQKLEAIVASEKSFHAWCDEQENTEYNMLKTRNLCRICAYTLKIANEKNYLIPGDFCKRVELNLILRTIHEKGAIYCMSGLYNNTPVGKYLKNLESLIEYNFNF